MIKLIDRFRLKYSKPTIDIEGLLPFHIKQIELMCLFNPHGVIHVGAHQGQEVPLYQSKKLKSIHLFEPQSKIAFDLRQRFAGQDNIVVYPVALGSSERKAPIFKEVSSSPNLSSSSSLLRPKQHLEDYAYISFEENPTEFVTQSPLDSFEIDDADLMVIDTQGYELEVLKGSTRTLRNIKWLIFEYWQNEAYEGCPTENDLLFFVKEQGFIPLMKTWDRTFGNYLVVKPEVLK